MPGSGYRVVVVDDDPALCEYFARSLRRANFSVETATCTNDALARLCDPRPIDLLVADLKLDDGNDGQTLASIARRLRPGICVLYVSGFDPPLFTPDFRREDFLHKPVFGSELLGCALEILQRGERLRRAA